MKCLDRKTIQVYSDSEVSKIQAKKTEDHLAECPACKELLKKIIKDKEWVRNTLNQLNPSVALPLGITVPEEPIIPNDQSSWLRKIFASSIRIPVPVGFVLLILFLGLASYTFLLQMADSRSRIHSSDPGRKTTLFLFSADSVQVFDLKADLTDYRPIEKSKAYIFKEATQ